MSDTSDQFVAPGDTYEQRYGRGRRALQRVNLRGSAFNGDLYITDGFSDSSQARNPANDFRPELFAPQEFVDPRSRQPGLFGSYGVQYLDDHYPLHHINNTKLVKTPDLKSVVVSARQCGCSVLTLESAPTLLIRRRGQEQACLRYLPFEITGSGSEAHYLFDRKLDALTPGRYEMMFVIGGTPHITDPACGTLCVVAELTVPNRCNIGGVAAVTAQEIAAPSRPEGIEDVFDGLEFFNAQLCGVLESDAVVLPLSAEDTASLCAGIRCHPVQLRITDGTKSEVIEITECVAGQPVVVRGATNMQPRRFPRGSRVRFEWTAANVRNACEPCPI
jgi:hypothetical protein